MESMNIIDILRTVYILLLVKIMTKLAAFTSSLALLLISHAEDLLLCSSTFLIRQKEKVYTFESGINLTRFSLNLTKPEVGQIVLLILPSKVRYFKPKSSFLRLTKFLFERGKITEEPFFYF